MANSSKEYWEIDGVSLHQYGWSVTTLGGGRIDLPPLRGDDIKRAGRRGARHRPKLADSRVISLAMWVTGSDPATGIPGQDQILRWNDSWDFLKRMVWKPRGAQVTLTRRQWLTVDGTPTLVVSDAQAQIGDTMTPTMTGRTRADFTMNLILADPYFYGRELEEVQVDANDSVSLFNAGHDAVTDMEIDLVGPLTSPKLINETPDPNIWAQVDRTILTGRTVRLDTDVYTAKYVAGAVGSVLNGFSHAGSVDWMELAPGANLMTLDTSSGGDTGHAIVRYRPVYV